MKSLFLFVQVGGIKAFGCYLAEDYFFAKSITKRGWKISISSQPAWQNSGFCDIPSFQARITRLVPYLTFNALVNVVLFY